MQVTIYTDGGSRGNPGPAGVGWVIEIDGIVKKENSKYLGEQTNNWAEYEAVVCALQDVKRLVPKDARKKTKIELRLDSELVARQLLGEYQIKDEPLQLQYMKVHNIRVSDFPMFSVSHIPREENIHADSLANTAMDGGMEKLL